MKLTLREVIDRVNLVLNYPSIAYEDVYHFFDHAIAELNTILKIAIPSVSEMRKTHAFNTTAQSNTIELDPPPAYGTLIPSVSEIPTDEPVGSASKYVYFTSNENMIDRKFYVWNGSMWKPYEALYGIAFEGASMLTYVAFPQVNGAFWKESEADLTLNFDLCAYMPMDWWILFVIPYVCFKFAVRNGDDGALYNSEFAQGLQQLQTSYDVPNTVVLSEVAGNPVYTNEVSQHLNALHTRTVTKAITDNMRVGNAISAIFDTSNSVGGWGI